MEVRCILISLCAYFGVTFSYDIQPPIPVPTPQHGMRYNPSAMTPQVRLEMFVDIHCSDSAAAWPVIKSVQQHYTNTELDVIVQQMPLPYHRNAFLATQGLFAVQDIDALRVIDYLEANWANTANFSTANTKGMTEHEVLDMLADLTYQSTGIPQTLFKDNIDYWLWHSITVWKYAAKRLVAGTPTYFVNGVDLAVGPAMPTYDDWITFLDPLIHTTPQ